MALNCGFAMGHGGSGGSLTNLGLVDLFWVLI